MACSATQDVVGVRVGPEATDVLWACPGCRTDVVRAEAAKPPPIAVVIARRLSALELLDAAPIDVAAAIRAQAAVMPPGIRLSPESPLYRQRLAHFAEVRLRPTGE